MGVVVRTQKVQTRSGSQKGSSLRDQQDSCRFPSSQSLCLTAFAPFSFLSLWLPLPTCLHPQQLSYPQSPCFLRASFTSNFQVLPSKVWLLSHILNHFLQTISFTSIFKDSLGSPIEVTNRSSLNTCPLPVTAFFPFTITFFKGHQYSIFLSSPHTQFLLLWLLTPSCHRHTSHSGTTTS